MKVMSYYWTVPKEKVKLTFISSIKGKNDYTINLTLRNTFRFEIMKNRE